MLRPWLHAGCSPSPAPGTLNAKGTIGRGVDTTWTGQRPSTSCSCPAPGSLLQLAERCLCDVHVYMTLFPPLPVALNLMAPKTMSGASTQSLGCSLVHATLDRLSCLACVAFPSLRSSARPQPKPALCSGPLAQVQCAAPRPGPRDLRPAQLPGLCSVPIAQVQRTAAAQACPV